MSMNIGRWLRALMIGLLIGLIAALLMTLVMAVLRVGFGISPPPESIPDRFAPTLPISRFFKLIGDYGGYNGLKRFGVRSVIRGQIGAGALLGILFSIIVEWDRARHPERRWRFGLSRAGTLFVISAVAVLWIASVIILWPVLGANYRGLPPTPARIVTMLGLLVAYASYGLGLVLLHRFITRSVPRPQPATFDLPIARRALLTAGLGVALGLASRGMIRRLERQAVFPYDGTRVRGPNIAPVTPNDQFYVVTKNVVDPRVAKRVWRLEVTGHVEHARTYDFEDLTALPSVEQEATLTCISNRVGDTLISNAVWRGVPMRTLLAAAQPKPGAAEVLLHAVDGYTDTFAIEKAMEPTTLVAYAMNNSAIPDRHGYPARIVVPGLFGEKNVKWITRIEVVDHDAKGFYEQQGWGPSFVVPTRSQFTAPDLRQPVKTNAVTQLKGLAFAGNRGISKVEVSVDNGETWTTTKIDYPGSQLSWALWSYDWQPTRTGDYKLLVRATDRAGELQTAKGRGIVSEGATGYHQVTAHVVGRGL